MRSAERVLTVLSAFSHEQPMTRVAELSEELGLAYSTVRRILMVLEKHDLVRYDDAAKAYVVGYEVLRLAQLGASQDLLAAHAVAVMDQLHHETSETVLLSRRSREHVVRVLVRFTNHTLRVDAQAAVQRPLFVGSATGKTLLAWEDEATVVELLPERWDALTRKTITTRDDYLEALRKVRRKGYAINDEESEIGVWSVAAPVYDGTDRAVAALTITIPATRLDARRRTQIVNTVLASALDLSAKVRASGI